MLFRSGYLRDELGYNGVVIVDDLEMKAVADQYGAGEAAVMALLAGNDLAMVCNGGRAMDEAHEGIARDAMPDNQPPAQGYCETCVWNTTIDAITDHCVGSGYAGTGVLRTVPVTFFSSVERNQNHPESGSARALPAGRLRGPVRGMAGPGHPYRLQL